MNLPEEKTWRSRVKSAVNDRLTLATILLGITIVIVAIIGFGLRNGSSGTVANTTSSNSQVAVASPSASPASALITPSPVPGSQPVQIISGGGSGGGSGSTSGGSTSTSSTSLKTDNAYNYYTTLANGQLVASNPTPTPAAATPTPNPNNPSVLGATCGTGETWTGTGGTDWNTAGNWSDSRVPCSTDDIIIPSTTNKPTLNVSGGSVTVSSLTMTGSTLTISNGSATKQFIVTNNVGLTTSTITHATNTNTQASILVMSVGGNMTINSGSYIDVSNDGYTSSGPGAGTGGRYGGSYGGWGGDGSGSTSAAPYGSITQPLQLGSNSGALYGAAPGGGAVKLTVSGTLTNNGGIWANGQGSYAGGSGGSVWVSANAWSGSGTIQANGGSGNYTNYNCAAGAGGRIALYSTTGTVAGTLTATGGADAGNAYFGGGGTIYTFISTSTNGNLTIGAPGYTGYAKTLNQLGTSETYDNFNLGDNNAYTIPSGYTLTATTYTLTPATQANLTNNGTLNGSPSMFANSPNLYFNNYGTLNGLSGATTVSLYYFSNSGNVDFGSGTTAMTLGAGVNNSGTITASTLNITSSAGSSYNNAGGNFNVTNLGLTLNGGGNFNNYSLLGSGSGTNLTYGAGTFVSYGTTPSVALNLASLTMTGGTLTHQANYNTQTYTLNLNVAGNVTICASCTINVSGKGYTMSGPGVPTSGAYGGSYGGLGGGGGTNNLYGSVTQPTQLGSNSETSNYSCGGGGAIKLTVGGTFTNNNTTSGITADGSGCSYQAGGASGGSVWVSANAWSGTGSVSSQGGFGWNIYNNFGGGGGRIALYATTGSVSGTQTAKGGYDLGGTNNYTGAGGTIYIKNASSTYGNLTIDKSGGTNTYSRSTYMTGTNSTETYDTFILSDYVNYTVPSGDTLTATSYNLATSGSTTINNNGTINGNATMFASAPNLSFQSGGTINGLSGATTINLASFYLSALNNISFTSPTVSITVGGFTNYATLSGATINLTSTSGSLYNYGNLNPTILNLSGNFYNYGQLGSGSGTNLTYSSGTFESDNTTPSTALNLASLNMTGGTMTHAANYNAQTYTLNLNVAGDMTICGSCTLNVSSKGYTMSGPGVPTDGRNGGSYGGLGNGGSANSLYGSVAQPTQLGSNSELNNYNCGGGGAVKLTVGGTFANNNTTTGITADGSGCSYQAGGASGGSVWISAHAWSGTGSISSQGGFGWNVYNTYGGGGGRIALYTTTGSVTGTQTAKGGYDLGGGSNYVGSGGTIYIKNASSTYGNLTIDKSGGTNTYSRTTYMTGTNTTETYDTFTLSDYVSYTVPSGDTLTATTYNLATSGSTTLNNNGTLNGNAAMFASAPNLTFNNSGTLTGVSGATAFNVSNFSNSSQTNAISFSSPILTITAPNFYNASSWSGTNLVLNVSSNGTNAPTGTLNFTTITSNGAGAFSNQGSLGTSPNLTLTAGTFEFGNTNTSTAQNLASLTLTGGARVTHKTNSYLSSQTYSLNLNIAGNASICSSCSINADSKGFNSSNGPGHPSNTSAGGTYGGQGGGSGVTATYGSMTQPVSLGSPGGGSFAFNGGGAIKLVVGGTFTNSNTNGGVSANGDSASSNGGSASGGSVWIVAGTWTGSGSIIAKGGDGYSPYGNYGGGGGRIALYAASGSVAGTQSAAGGGSTYPGNAGTVYIGSSSAVTSSPDSGGNVGQFTSIDVNASGIPSVAYYDVTNGHLKFIRCSNASCSSVASTVTVDSAAGVGTYASMKLDSSGIAHIAYYDATGTHLKYALCNDTNCSSPTLSTVDSAAGVGTHASLALYGGVPRISYYDTTNGHLKYALCDAAACSTPAIRTVDSGTAVGFYSSIAVDSTGVPSIAYYDSTNSHPKYLKCADATCASAPSYTIDNTSNTGLYTALALNASGVPSIAYYDSANSRLKYAQCSTVSCSSAPTSYVVDASASVIGQYTSIGIGTDGLARISYYDNTDGFLKFAKCTTGACSAATIITADSSANVGRYTSTVVASDGMARVSYYDVTNGDLKVWLESPAAITSFYFSAAPSSGAAGAASSVFTVGARDVNGNTTSAAANTNVYLYKSSGTGTFSTASGGTYTSALTVVMTSGSGNVSFYYKDNTASASPYTIYASDQSSFPSSDTGITDATASYTVNAGPATVAVLSPSTLTTSVNQPTSAITLTTKDAAGNTAPVVSSTVFSLSSTGTGGQFSLTSAPFSSVSSVTVGAGNSTATFYYQNSNAAGYTLTAHNASFTDGTASVTVTPPVVTSFYFATAPASGTAAAASTVFTIGAKDVSGNIISAVGSNTDIYMYSSGSGSTFSTTSGGTYTAALHLVITSGTGTVNFFYKNNSTSGSPYTLTASDNATSPDGIAGIVDATTGYTVNAASPTVTQLTPSSQTIAAGAASSAFTLTTKDSLGNPSPVASNTAFTLSDASAGGEFSLTSSPFTPISVVTVNNGSSNATFYYRNSTAGGYTLTVHNAGFANVTAGVTVNAAGISSYYYTSAPTSANINVASGAFVVGAHDVFGNVVTVGSNTTVYLYSTSGTGTFSNTTSAGPFTVTSATITSGNTTATFYYKDSAAAGVTITASDQTPTHTPDTGIVDANTAFTVFNPDVKVGPNMPETHKSATFSDTRPGDPNIHFSWVSTHASTVKAVRIQVCTDGLANTACTAPTGSDLTPATLISTGGELGVTGWAITTVVSGHEILITNATGAATTIGGTSTLDLANFTNPTSIGTFFFRVSTYSTTAALPGDSVSYGAFGTSTNRSLTVTGDVAESLVFRVANSVASDCSSQTDIADPNDAASDLVTLSPNPMTMTTTSIGTAQMCATSNAEHGYTITYHDAALGGATKGFYNGSHEFAVANLFTSTQGTEQFGFNLRANTTPAVGFDPDGSGLVADLTNADYGTVDKYSYNDTGSPTILAQKSAPNAATARYTMSYIANISSTTAGGTYKAHQIFVITATY